MRQQQPGRCEVWRLLSGKERQTRRSRTAEAAATAAAATSTEAATGAAAEAKPGARGGDEGQQVLDARKLPWATSGPLTPVLPLVKNANSRDAAEDMRRLREGREAVGRNKAATERRLEVRARDCGRPSCCQGQGRREANAPDPHSRSSRQRRRRQHRQWRQQQRQHGSRAEVVERQHKQWQARPTAAAGHKVAEANSGCRQRRAEAAQEPRENQRSSSSSSSSRSSSSRSSSGRAGKAKGSCSTEASASRKGEKADLGRAKSGLLKPVLALTASATSIA